MTPVSELEAWLRGRPKGTTRLALRQVVRGEAEKASTVQEYDTSDTDWRELAQQVDRHARDDASDTGGTCRYALVALDADGRILGRRIFRRAGEVTSDAVGPEEPPTAAGLVGQAMRHTEAAYRMSLESVGSTQRALLAENARLAERCRQLEAKEFETIELFERLASQQNERQIAAADAAQRAAYKARVMNEIVAPIVPKLVGKVLSKVLPEETLAHEAASLFESIETEQLERIFETLNEGQQKQLARLIAGTAPKTTPAGTPDAEGTTT